MLRTAADSGVLQQQAQQPLWRDSAADLLLPASGETSQKSLGLATSDPLEAGPADVTAVAAVVRLRSEEAGGMSKVEQPQQSASPAGPEGAMPSSAGSAAPHAALPQPNNKVEGIIPGPSAAPAVPAGPSGIQAHGGDGPEPQLSCHGGAPALTSALPALPTAPAAAGPAAAAAAAAAAAGAAPPAAAPPGLGFAGSSASFALEQHLASLIGPPPPRSDGWPLHLQALPQAQHPGPQLQHPAPQVPHPAPQVQHPAPQPQRPAPPPPAKPPQKQQRQQGGAEEAAQAGRSLPLGQWEGMPHAGQVWEGLPLGQGQRQAHTQQQQQPQHRQQHSGHPMPAPPLGFGIPGAGQHLLPHGLLPSGSQLDKMMNNGRPSSRPQSRQEEQKGGPYTGAVLAAAAQQQQQQQAQPAMPRQPNPWFGAREGAFEPGKAQHPSLWAAASGLAHCAADQHRGQQQQQQDAAAAAMYNLAQQMGLGGNPSFFNPAVPPPPPHLFLGAGAPQTAYPRPLPPPALQQLLAQQQLQPQAPLPGLEVWGGAPWVAAPAAQAPNKAEQQPPRLEVRPPLQQQQQQEEVQMESEEEEQEEEEEEDVEEGEEYRGAHSGQQAQRGSAEGAGEGRMWEGAAPGQSPLVTEDAILAASALKALQGAALPRPSALLSPAGQEGPPILLSMLQQGGGAGAGAHSRRKSAPHKLPWAGELVEARAGGGSSHAGPKHNSRPPSRGPRGASLDGDWVPTASSAGGRGGRGRGRGGGGAGRGNGRGGRGGAAQQDSGRSTPLGDGVRPALAAALEMMANMRGSRRSFAVDQSGTFVKAILSRELEGCKYIKIPDVYREMLVGDSTEAVFLHRASGKEWQLSVTPLKLKWWMPEFGMQVGDELVLRSALDDPAQKQRTHAPDGTPIVLMEVWREGSPLPASAAQQPAALPLRNGGGAAVSKRERGSGEGSHAGSYGAAGGSLEGTGDEMEDGEDEGDEEYEWGWHRPARRPRSYGAGGASRTTGGPAAKDGAEEERIELENGRQEAVRPAASSAWEAANLLLQRYAAASAQQGVVPPPQAAQQQQQQQQQHQQGGAGPAATAVAVPAVKQEAQQAEQQSYITQSNDSSIPVALRFMFAAAGHKHVEVRRLPKGEGESRLAGPGPLPQGAQQIHPQQAQQPQPPQVQQVQQVHPQQAQQGQPWQEQQTQTAQALEAQPRETAAAPATVAPVRVPVSTAAAAAAVAAAAAALAAEQGQPSGGAARSTGSQPATQTEAGKEVGAGAAGKAYLQQQQQGAETASNQGQQRLLKYSMLADLMGILVASGVDAGLQEAFSRAFLDTFDDAMRNAVYSGVREASALSDSERVLEWVQVALEDL